MTKLVVLKLDGDLSQGVRVTLEISSEGERAEIEVNGFLPAALELIQVVDKWQDGYHRLGTATRITDKEIIINGGEITPQKCLENAKQVRSHLNQWLGSSGFRPIWNKCLQQLQPHEEVRVLIRTSSEALQKLPWQLWELIDEYPLAEVALSTPKYEHCSVRNQVKKQIKILAILGDSTGINVDEDRKSLDNLLPYAKATFLEEPQREEISDQLWEQSWDILFFAGHSWSEGETGRIYINRTDSLTIDELKRGLEKARGNGLQLAIFNSCDGLGLGRALQRLQIPQMIVMREPVPDLVAQRYLKYLLQAFIIEDKSLYLAQRQARERLEDLENKFPCASWLPILIQHPAVIPPTRDQLRGLSSRSSSTVRDQGTRLKGQELRNRRDHPFVFSNRRYIAVASIITLVSVLAFGAAFLGEQPQNREIYRYSDFLQAVERGQIAVVRFSADGSTALVTRVDGDRKSVKLVNDPNLINTLINSRNVDIRVFPKKSIFSKIFSYFNHDTSKYLDYGDLIRKIQNKEVEKVELNQDQQIAKVYLKGQKPNTPPLQVRLLKENPELIQKLNENNVSYENVQ